MTKPDPKPRDLLEETFRELRKESVYWSVDHPSESMLDRQADHRGVVDSAFRGQGHRESFDGATAAGEGSRTMLRVARDRLRPHALADRAMSLRATIRPELSEHIEKVLRSAYRCDVARARSEIAHFEGYAKFYDATPSTKPKLNGPVTDRRMPREPGDDDDLPPS